MITPFHKFLCAVVATAMTVAAQGTCPKKQARTVPEQFRQHGNLGCGGVKVNVGSVGFQTSAQVCPSLIVYSPEHEVETDSPNDTMVELYSRVAVELVFLRCEQTWYAVIPWGSHCAIGRTQHGAAMARMRTVPCSPR